MVKNIVIITLVPALFISIFLLVEASSSIEELKSSLKETTVALNNAKIQLIYKEAQIKNINRKYDELKITSKVNKFLFYYNPLTEKMTCVSDLEKYLSRYEWKEDTYKTDIFDCSEMSAVLERMLENEGFHTFIVSGEAPDGSGEKHSWLIVETSPDKYIPVGATDFSIIPWYNPYINEYHSYEYKFETIHEALDYSQKDYDWWEQ